MNMFKVFLTSMVLTSGLLSACTMQGSYPAPERTDSSLTDNGFLLGPGDTVKVVVYGDEQLSDQYMVSESGYISVPLIGDVLAEGLSTNELQAHIIEYLEADELYEHPYVTVESIALRPFYIIGEVNAPGSYAFQPSLDVFQAVALAGGYAPRAAKNRIILTRIVDGKKKRLSVNEDTPIQPGDSILVDQRLF